MTFAVGKLLRYAALWDFALRRATSQVCQNED